MTLSPHTPLSAENVGLLKAGDWVADGPIIGKLQGQADGWGCATLIAPNGSEFSRILHRHAFTYIGPDFGDGWIGWSGGREPVPHDTPGLIVRCRNGAEHIAAGFASHYWQHDGDGCDIVAFKFSLPAGDPFEGFEEAVAEIERSPEYLALGSLAPSEEHMVSTTPIVKREGGSGATRSKALSDLAALDGETMDLGVARPGHGPMTAEQVAEVEQCMAATYPSDAPSPVDWSVVGPKLVEALRTARDYVSDAQAGHSLTRNDACRLIKGEAVSVRLISMADNDLATIDAALAAAQPQSNGESR